MASPATNSFTDWLATTFSPCTRRPDNIEIGFGDWLTERLNAEQHAIIKQLQSRQKDLHAEVMDAFRQSLHSQGHRKLSQVSPPPVMIEAPGTPESPQVTLPVVHGSPVAVVVDPGRPMTPCEPSVKASPIVSIKDSPASPTVSRISNGNLSAKNDQDTRSQTAKDTQSANTGCEAPHWHRFEILFGAGILLNALVMLVEGQYYGLNMGFALGVKGFRQSGREVLPAAESTFDVLNVLFNIMFTIELICRLNHDRCKFYRSFWIWVDLIVVPFAWLDIFHVLKFPVSSPAMIRVFRVLRLFQLIEVMERFEKLYLLIRSIKASFGALLWSMLMILFTQVVAALWLQCTLSAFYEDTSKPEAVRQDVFERFGTTSRCLLTMFQVVFANWTQPCWMLVLNVSEWYGVFFVLYRCVLGFSLIRVISSMFIAETHRICTEDKEMAALKKNNDEDAHKKQLRHMFEEVDRSGNGVISWQELQVMLKNKKLLRYVEKMGTNPLHLTELFKILKTGGETVHDSYVKLDDFVSGVLKVEGAARSMDILAVAHAVERLQSRLDAAEVKQCMPFESFLNQDVPYKAQQIKLLDVQLC